MDSTKSASEQSVVIEAETSHDLPSHSQTVVDDSLLAVSDGTGEGLVEGDQ